MAIFSLSGSVFPSWYYSGGTLPEMKTIPTNSRGNYYNFMKLTYREKESVNKGHTFKDQGNHLKVTELVRGCVRI